MGHREKALVYYGEAKEAIGRPNAEQALQMANIEAALAMEDAIQGLTIQVTYLAELVEKQGKGSTIHNIG